MLSSPPRMARPGPHCGSETGPAPLPRDQDAHRCLSCPWHPPSAMRTVWSISHRCAGRGNPQQPGTRDVVSGPDVRSSTGPDTWVPVLVSCYCPEERTAVLAENINTERQIGTALVKRGMAEMLKGGVIMDVVTPEQAKIAEDAGAVAVMALERVPADIRAQGGVS